MFFASDFDKNLENATSHLKMEPDWETILLIGDGIRQGDVTPKQAITAIRKRVVSANPHTSSYALLVLESIVKNCGAPIHDEICTKESCEWFTQFIETTPHENAKAKMLELIQVWAFAFRTYDKYQAIRDIVTILKTKGHKFPELKEADAMFTSETAPDWSDGKVCSRCRVPFSFTQRKHHCRNCGRIFCAQCSSRTCTLPKFGIEKEVRVCDGCYMTMHHAPGVAGARPTAVVDKPKAESDLPAEYLASTLSQQSQQPPRKSEQELKEEEELQLALALSQSEAEAQKSRTSVYRPMSTAAAAATVSSSVRKPSDSLYGSGSPADAFDAPAAVASQSGNAGESELAKYMNRDYWEQRKMLDSPASPSAPSPMSQTSIVTPLKSGPDEVEMNEFAQNMRQLVEIFVNRMRSDSSRGRNIVTDSAVQTQFITLTTYHSRMLTFIKDMDDRRQWYEQLQDKLAQVKDSRAALDVLRQEHRDKMRAIAEEQERQRQLMMAHKLDVMRKKKQEYLQYQRQMALKRIQEQEREMAMRQEQQKALYQMGGTMQFGGGPLPPPQQPGIGAMHGSPLHQGHGAYPPMQQQPGPAMMYGQPAGPYGQLAGIGSPMMMGGHPPPPQQQQHQQHQQHQPHGMYGLPYIPPPVGQFMGQPQQQQPGMLPGQQPPYGGPDAPHQLHAQQPQQPQPHQQPMMINQQPALGAGPAMAPQHGPQMAAGLPQQHQPAPLQQQQQQPQMQMGALPNLQHAGMAANVAAPAQPPAAVAAAEPVAAAAAAAVVPPPPAAVTEPAEAELICFD